MELSALFPPLFPDDETENGEIVEGKERVDISVDDIQLPALEKAVETSIYEALKQWNDIDPAHVETTLVYMERLKKYRSIVNCILYNNEEDYIFAEDESDQEENAGEDGAEDDIQRKKQQQRQVRRETKKKQKQKQKEQTKRREHLQKLQQIFYSLPRIENLRAEREPSAKVKEFVTTYKMKKRTLAQKRSVADTATSLCFEFARAPLLPADAGAEKKPNINGNKVSGEHGASSNIQSPHTKRLKIVPTITSQDPILWLEVLHPSKDPAKTQSFLVRGSQKLCDLVDLIVCAYDQRLEIHERHSKLIYFDTKFYIDRRRPDYIDYSQEIRTWIRDQSDRIEKYGDPGKEPSLSLEATIFADLPMKIDVPGLYIHQGECEHLLRIRDVRLPHEYDADTNSGLFPMRLPNTHYRALRNCLICQHYSAKFICYGDRLSIADPMFFCERCYRAAHYDADGKLLYDDFQSFPYIQD